MKKTVRQKLLSGAPTCLAKGEPMVPPKVSAFHSERSVRLKMLIQPNLGNDPWASNEPLSALIQWMNRWQKRSELLGCCFNLGEPDQKRKVNEIENKRKHRSVTWSITITSRSTLLRRVPPANRDCQASWRYRHSQPEVSHGSPIGRPVCPRNSSADWNRKKPKASLARSSPGGSYWRYLSTSVHISPHQSISVHKNLIVSSSFPSWNQIWAVGSNFKIPTAIRPRPLPKNSTRTTKRRFMEHKGWAKRLITSFALIPGEDLQRI